MPGRLQPALVLAALLALWLSPLGVLAGDEGGKASLVASIDEKAESYWEAALDIWHWAEPGYQEERSSQRLIGLLEAAEFKVERNVAGIPTAFVAEYGSGRPVIGVLAEFDALPGLSQKALPTREAREDTSWGHGCGHHLFGVASTARFNSASITHQAARSVRRISDSTPGSRRPAI